MLRIGNNILTLNGVIAASSNEIPIGFPTSGNGLFY
jgi:hypothetical protein